MRLGTVLQGRIPKEIQRSLPVYVSRSCSRRLQHFRNASTMKQIPQAAVAMEWNLLNLKDKLPILLMAEMDE